MKEQESLSALMDGELSEFELRQLINQLSDNTELPTQWERFHLVRNVLQRPRHEPGALPALKLNDFSTRVRTAIDSEPAYTFTPQNTPQKSHSRNWRQAALRPVARVAVAASVSFVMVAGYQRLFMNGVDGGNGAGSHGGQTVAQQTPASPVFNLGLDSHSVEGNSGAAMLLTTARPQYLRQNVIPVSEGYSAQGTQSVITGDIIRAVPENEELTNAYFISHTGKTAVYGAQGVMPFARMITLDAPAQAPVVKH
jgi:sigma-E factor negative regulatory protein RseA